MAIKNYGLILKAKYVAAIDDRTLMKVIHKYEADAETQCGAFDVQILPGAHWKRYGEDRTYNTRVLAQANSGEYVRIYMVLPSENEQDYFRENAYKLEDRERDPAKPFKDEFHFRDERIESVKVIDKRIDSYTYWFVSQTSPELVDVVHIDLNEGNPYARSITKEYYATAHRDTELNQEERDWATILGYEGHARDGIKWILETFKTNEERLAFVNGMDKDHLGCTSDTQVVICPNCGRPTFAAPAMQAYTDTQAKIVPYELPAQMKCEHCGASLMERFAFNEGEIINIENAVTMLDFDDEDVED